MRMGFFNSYTLWGGGEKWHYTAAEFMAEQHGHEVYVFADPEGELYQRVVANKKLTAIPIHLNKHSYWNPLAQWHFYRLFKKLNLDSVVFNAPQDVRNAAYVARKAGTRNVIYRNGMPVAIAQKKSFIKAFQQGLTKLIVISEHCKRVLQEDSPKLSAGHDIEVIPNAFDFTKMPAKNDQPPATKKPGEIILSTTGRLTEQKGQIYLFEACHLLKQRGLNFRLWMVGDGELKDELTALCKKYELEDRINFLGFQANIYPYLYHSDIFVFPSLWEGRASSIIEAMATELPTVCFDISSMGEIITDQVTGFLAKPKDAKDFALKIQQLIENPQLRQQFGHQAMHVAQEDYNVSKVYERWHQILIS